MVHLNNIWFVIVAIFWVGFFVLEGFDFGVGMLHSFVGRNDVERRIAVNSIGPIWDGNEVWLVVAGAAIFAAFPAWYATMFSTFYLALLIVLVALIVRGVSFEFHRKIDNPRWRSTWRWSLTIGSAAHPAAARHRPRRPAPRAAHRLGPQLHRHLLSGCWSPSGSTPASPSPCCRLFLGATYLTLKTDGELHDRVRPPVRPARAGWPPWSPSAG